MSRRFSEGAFHAKLNAIAGIGQLVDAAKELYALLRDPATPLWVKGAAGAALAYLILPTDAVSDFVPGLGYGDDLAVLTGAVAAIAAHMARARAAGASGSPE